MLFFKLAYLSKSEHRRSSGKGAHHSAGLAVSNGRHQMEALEGKDAECGDDEQRLVEASAVVGIRRHEAEPLKVDGSAHDGDEKQEQKSDFGAEEGEAGQFAVVEWVVDDEIAADGYQSEHHDEETEK
jgi:hypothetical protein